MNYYEHHLGDYDGATAHLSWLEDCAYRRLLCLYYRNEGPVPADIRQACRLVRAATKPERAAVQQVLSEFFELQADGWHHSRCDAELAEYHESEPDRDAKRENAKERQRRARERRRTLFEALRGHDIVPAWDTTTKQLEALLSQAESRRTPSSVTPPVTEPVTRDNTATQTPVPNTQTPVPRVNKPSVGRGSRLPPDWSPDPDGMAFAEQQGLRNGRAQAELGRFRDYWTAQPGQKGVKTDWPATWRNWVRRAVESAPKAGQQSDDIFAGAH